MPVRIKTDEGFAVLINQLPICDFSQDVILCSQPIDMSLNLIKTVKRPVNKWKADGNAYGDRIKYKTATGNIPNTVITNPTLFTFPAANAFASGKIIICEMWVERLAYDCNIKSNFRNCVAWISQIFSRSVPCDIRQWFSRQGLDSHFSPRLYRTTMNQLK